MSAGTGVRPCQFLWLLVRPIVYAGLTQGPRTCVHIGVRGQVVCGNSICAHISVIHKGGNKSLQVYMRWTLDQECVDSCMCQGCELAGDRRAELAGKSLSRWEDSVQTLAGYGIGI